MRRALPLLALLAFAGPAAANIPAAFYACEGADEGAPCAMPGPFYGNCVRDTLCEDDPETEVDECLLCVDPCWAGLEAGRYCTRFDGSDGICEPQTMCTPDPEKSFAQCNRCVAGEIARTEPQDACAAGPGRAASRGAVAAAWLLLIALGLRQRRRG